MPGKITATHDIIVMFMPKLNTKPLPKAYLKRYKQQQPLALVEAVVLAEALISVEPALDITSLATALGHPEVVTHIESSRQEAAINALMARQEADKRATSQPDVVKIDLGMLTDATKPAALEAVASQCEDIFVHDGVLSVVVCDSYQGQYKKYKIDELSVGKARSLLGDKLRLGYRDEEGDFHDASIGEKVDVFKLFVEKGGWDSLRPIKSIISTPFLRPDGTVCQTASWCPQTHYLFRPGQAFDIAVPENPTLEDAKKALVDLCEPFEEFTFDDGSDRYVAIAAILTLLARPAIRGPVPGFIFDANCPGSGKSLAADAVCIIATGHDFPRNTFTADPEEQEKKLASMALYAPAVVGFDNVSVGFGGDALNKVLTSIRVEFRILGQSKMSQMSWEALVMATGNNMSVIGDTLRRVIRCRLRSDVARPEERPIKRVNLKEWCAENRARLVTAGLTLLRAYFVAGCPAPETPKKLGSFDEWTMIANAIVFAGGTNPIDNRTTAEEEDNDLASLEIIMEMMMGNAQQNTTGYLARDLCEKAEFPSRKNSMHDDRSEEVKAFADALSNITRRDIPTPIILGKRLAHLENRVLGEKEEAKRLKAVADGDGSQRKSGKRYIVEFVNKPKAVAPPAVPEVMQDKESVEAPPF